MITEVFAFELLEPGIFARRQPKGGLADLGGEDGELALLLHAAFLPFIGEFVPDGDGTQAFSLLRRSGYAKAQSIQSSL